MTYLMNTSGTHNPIHGRQPSNQSESLKKSKFCVKWKSAVLLLLAASVLLLGVLGVVTWKFILPSDPGGTPNREGQYGETIKIIETEFQSSSCSSDQLGNIYKICLHRPYPTHYYRNTVPKI